MIPRTAQLTPAAGFGQRSPAEEALGRAQRAAEFERNRLLGAYSAHPDPMRRQHPLKWTIDRDWQLALKAVMRAPTPSDKATVWRAAEKRLKEIAAMSKDELAKAADEQAKEIEEITAETVRRSPAPPPQPHAAEVLLKQLRERGVTISVDRQKLVVTPAVAVLDTELDALRQHKSYLMRLLAADQVEV